MKLFFSILILFVAIIVFAEDDQMQIVVSVRHLKIKGRSYHHLYLYREDGTLIRQLTDVNADDLEPKFSRDGNEIVFERWTPNGSTFFLLNLESSHLEEILELPYWYSWNQEMDDFHLLTSYESWGAKDETRPNTRYMPAPDDSIDLLINEKPDRDYIDDLEGYLRDRKTKKVTPISLLSGFKEFGCLMVSNQSPFLFEPELRVFFYRVHRGSTDGGAYYVVDVNRKKVKELTPNGGRIISLIWKSGFFCISEERYQPLGDGRTVNCSYLDWWNSELKRTRYSGSLGRFGGASIFQENGNWPLNISDLQGRALLK